MEHGGSIYLTSSPLGSGHSSEKIVFASHKWKFSPAFKIQTSGDFAAMEKIQEHCQFFLGESSVREKAKLTGDCSADAII